MRLNPHLVIHELDAMRVGEHRRLNTANDAAVSRAAAKLAPARFEVALQYVGIRFYVDVHRTA